MNYSPSDVDDAISAACMRMSSASGTEWIRTVLRNQALREAQGRVPGRGGRILEGDPPLVTDTWMEVASRVDNSGLEAHRVNRISVDQAFVSNEKAVERAERGKKGSFTGIVRMLREDPENRQGYSIDNTLPKKRDSVETVFKSELVPGARRCVVYRDDSTIDTYFDVGTSHLFHVVFKNSDGNWRRNWEPCKPIGKGSGLFPRIDAVLGEITSTFMEQVKPSTLVILGADGKRNQHNGDTYGRITPENYSFARILSSSENHERAAQNGCVAVVFISHKNMEDNLERFYGPGIEIDIQPPYSECKSYQNSGVVSEPILLDTDASCPRFG